MFVVLTGVPCISQEKKVRKVVLCGINIMFRGDQQYLNGLTLIYWRWAELPPPAAAHRNLTEMVHFPLHRAQAPANSI